MDENNEIFIISRNGNLKILKLILKFDIDNLINRQNTTGNPHFQVKIIIIIFQMLINNWADKNIKDINGNTVKFDNRMLEEKFKKIYGTRKLGIKE